MSNRKNILLIVDDEPSIQKMLTLILEEEEFKIVGTASGRQAIRLCASIKPDLILLDLGLPDMPGTEVITALREWSQVPIIVLSACAEDTAIVSALNLGANDYVTKPFSTDVLLARINACLRTCAIKELGEPHLSNGPVRMDLVRHEVYLREVPLALTPKEYELLRYFMANRGKMLCHKDILKNVWGAGHVDNVAYLRVYIGQLREKIEDNHSVPTFIITEPGIGYRMEIVQATAIAA